MTDSWDRALLYKVNSLALVSDRKIIEEKDLFKQS